jgi:protein SDA1
MKRKVGALEKIEADHAALRYKLKRDPQSYRDDFNNQYQQYETLRDLFLQNPSSIDSGLVAFMSPTATPTSRRSSPET